MPFFDINCFPVKARIKIPGVLTPGHRLRIVQVAVSKQPGFNKVMGLPVFWQPLKFILDICSYAY
jgi:hypothetical protein